MEKDFYFSDDGEFILDENKDIMDTSYDYNRSLIQGIQARLKFNKNEWPGASKNVGANISEFQGKPNTAEVGAQIKTRIIVELTKDGFLKTTDLKVDIIPFSETEIICKILVKSKGKVLVYNHYFSYREKPHFNIGDTNAI